MEKASFNFVAAVIIHSDIGAQENKICHCFHFFPFYLPWSDGTRIHDLSFMNAILLSQLLVSLSQFFHSRKEELKGFMMRMKEESEKAVIIEERAIRTSKFQGFVFWLLITASDHRYAGIKAGHHCFKLHWLMWLPKNVKQELGFLPFPCYWEPDI